MIAPLYDGPGLATRRVRVARHEVAWVRWIVEAHEGLANVHGDGEGTISLVAPDSRARELDRLIDDLAEEIALDRV